MLYRLSNVVIHTTGIDCLKEARLLATVLRWPFFFFSLPTGDNELHACNWFLLLVVVNLPSVQFSSVALLCPTLCDPMNRSMPGLPVHHQLPEFTQSHVHRVYLNRWEILLISLNLLQYTFLSCISGNVASEHTCLNFSNSRRSHYVR